MTVTNHHPDTKKAAPARRLGRLCLRAEIESATSALGLSVALAWHAGCGGGALPLSYRPDARGGAHAPPRAYRRTVTGVDDLITWFRACLDAHERNICPDLGDCQRMFHSADENWMLDDIAAKRRLLDVILGYEAEIDGEWGCGHTAEQIAAGECSSHLPDEIEAIKLLALPYAGRPGYRDEWRP